MNGSKNCYDKINFELTIETEGYSNADLQESKRFEPLKQEINSLLILELPQMLKKKYGLEVYVKIDGYRQGSLIIIGSLIIMGLDTVSHIKDLYEIINLIKFFILNRAGPMASIEVTSVDIKESKHYEGIHPMKDLSKEMYFHQNVGNQNLILQIVTVILLIFLIGIYLGKTF